MHFFLSLLPCLTCMNYLRKTFPALPHPSQEMESKRTRLRGVFLTHVHADFVPGHMELGRRGDADVYYGPSVKARGCCDVQEVEDDQVWGVWSFLWQWIEFSVSLARCFTLPIPTRPHTILGCGTCTHEHPPPPSLSLSLPLFSFFCWQTKDTRRKLSHCWNMFLTTTVISWMHKLELQCGSIARRKGKVGTTTTTRASTCSVKKKRLWPRSFTFPFFTSSVQVIALSKRYEFRAVLTPGHTTDSVTWLLQETFESGTPRVLYVCVLPWCCVDFVAIVKNARKRLLKHNSSFSAWEGLACIFVDFFLWRVDGHNR